LLRRKGRCARFHRGSLKRRNGGVVESRAVGDAGEKVNKGRKRRVTALGEGLRRRKKAFQMGTKEIQGHRASAEDLENLLPRLNRKYERI